MTKTLVLAFVQGITEFIPISSSGHLALCNRLFPPAESDFFLMVFLHGGTLASVFLYFRRDIALLARAVFRKNPPGADPPMIGPLSARAYLLAIGLGTLPVVMLGLPLKRWAENTFHSLPALSITFLLTAAWLALPGLFARGKSARAPGPARALLIGLAQATALFPGISRSGSTIATGLLSGVSRAEAFRFSFLLSLPAVTAAFIWESLTVSGPLPGAAALAAGTVVSFLVGLGALHLLRKTVVSGRLYLFSVYLALLSLAIIFTGGR